MAKFCANGHQMEDSWPDCPYCMRAGFQHNAAGSGLDKTRIEGPGAAPNLSAAADGGKTVMLSPRNSAALAGWLVAINGKSKGEDYRLREGQNVLGSSSGADITLKGDPAISSKHAGIRAQDGVFSLTDLGSTNGTFLNGESTPVTGAELNDNDILRLGETSFKFKRL